MGKKSIKLNTGHEMPIIGLGVFMAKPGETQQAVEQAIDAGYRHFDTAFLYFNEAEVGQGIKKKIAEGKVKREDIFVTTKLGQTYMTPERVPQCLEKSLKALDIGYIDLYLVHSPMGFKGDQGDHVVFPTDDKGNWLLHDVDHAAVWKEMEKAVDSGKVRSIGVSNFNARQIQFILDNSRIKPSNLQVECHLYNQQKELTAFCHKNGISVTGYGNLGNPAMQAMRNPNFGKEENNTNVLEEPALKPLMSKYNKTAAQVALRYLTQRDIICIPKSVNPKRMAENINIFDFELTKEEMETLGKLDRKERIYTRSIPDNAKQCKDYPFQDSF